VEAQSEEKRLDDERWQAQKLDALAQLAGGIAHDFNNLLLIMTLAHGEVQSFANRGLPAPAGDLEDLRIAVERASELTHALMAFSRRQPAERQVLDLRGVVERALPMLTRATKGGLALAVEAEESVHAWGDAAHVQLVLLNLALNACDAQPKSGTAQIRVGSCRIEATTPTRPPELEPGDYATLSFSDDGVGMSRETRQRIFEPFFTTKAVGMGTGLGLATAHGLLRQMSGAIQVTSELGIGTAFTLYLPRADPAPTSERAVAASGLLRGDERVLLVEDEPTVRRLASRTLRDRGYDLVEVSTAEEALALPQGELEGFRLVLSDFRLPGMDGLTLLSTLKNRLPGIETLLMSGYIGERTERREAAHAFIGKPFTVDELARRVREILDARRER
jgi:two-component system, cell cycle sensor histidine kinase and response regulator CckA